MILNFPNFNILEAIQSIDVPTHEEKINIFVSPIKYDGHQVIFGKSNSNDLLVLFLSREELSELKDIPVKFTESIFLSARTLLDPLTNLETRYSELKFTSRMDPILIAALIEELFNLMAVAPDFRLHLDIPELIERWRKMLSSTQLTKMTLSEAIGLAGELYFLNHLGIILKEDSTKYWIGTSGARHDFEFQNSSFEIKTTLQRNREEVTIHGFNQLSSFEGKKLFMILIKCELEPFGINLIELVNDLLSQSQLDKRRFLEKLRAAGYDHEAASPLEDLRFNFTEFVLIEIDENFPAVTRSALSKLTNGNRIKDLQYVLDVYGLEKRLAESLELLDLQSVI